MQTTREHPTAAATDVAELARRIRAGENAAEQELVERYSRGVGFFLGELTRDASSAQDLLQETFRLAIQKIRAGELRQPDRIVAFVRQIARNLFIAEYRKKKQQPSISGEDALIFSRDLAPSPLQQVLDKENISIVRRLLRELEPPRDREILIRLFVAEQSKQEICDALGLSSLHFNRVLHRARQRLKKLLVSYHQNKSSSQDLARERQ